MGKRKGKVGMDSRQETFDGSLTTRGRANYVNRADGEIDVLEDQLATHDPRAGTVELGRREEGHLELSVERSSARPDRYPSHGH